MKQSEERKISAVVSTVVVYLDGTEISLLAYNINGNNYYKLRDLGKTIDFGVAWDGGLNTISIVTTIGYEDEIVDYGEEYYDIWMQGRDSVIVAFGQPISEYTIDKSECSSGYDGTKMIYAGFDVSLNGYSQIVTIINVQAKI